MITNLEVAESREAAMNIIKDIHSKKANSTPISVTIGTTTFHRDNWTGTPEEYKSLILTKYYKNDGRTLIDRAYPDLKQTGKWGY